MTRHEDRYPARTETRVLPDVVLSAWALRPGSVRPLGTGLINRTFLAETHAGVARVIQQVNPIFPPEINEDIDEVTRHLEARGLPTPRLVATGDGRRWIDGEDDRGAWRALTYLPGRALERLERPAQAEAAARLLARFHRALEGYERPFRSRRPPIHALERHLATLRTALETRTDHRAYGRIAPLGEEILAAAGRLDPLAETPPRVVHGDPKINNVVFHESRDEAIGLVDLDTLGRMPLPLELGDALRSWCNPGGEDVPEARFSLPMFAAAVAGYGAGSRGWIGADEVTAIVPATATIQVELAARFCADALNESYFGWDPERFPSRSEHNRVRAAGQLALHRSLLLQRPALDDAVSAAFPGA